MKASIDREGCIGCGVCAGVCPEAFAMADDGKAEVCIESIPAESQSAAEDARDNCPVSVIHLMD